ncbi:hypothetical protein Pcinc_031780 [Petrolisthes cinctipes]|uniref:Uncharacterized protein n=1 Tax=Petrolisthes cinctipes TaxID=88211 RepID=A0AAE1EWB0_PETCI|nr:hypothetical protein Pcinc_031780 [Petrolisthes cinctipes]
MNKNTHTFPNKNTLSLVDCLTHPPDISTTTTTTTTFNMVQRAVVLGAILLLGTCATISSAQKSPGEVIMLALSQFSPAEQQEITQYMVNTLRNDPEHFLSCVVENVPAPNKESCHPMAFTLRVVIKSLAQNQLQCGRCRPEHSQLVNTMAGIIHADKPYCQRLLTGLREDPSVLTGSEKTY